MGGGPAAQRPSGDEARGRVQRGRGVRSRGDGDDVWTKRVCPLTSHVSKPFPHHEDGRTRGLREAVGIRRGREGGAAVI